MARSCARLFVGRRTFGLIRRTLVLGGAGLGLGVALLAAVASPADAQTQFAAAYAGTTTQTLYSTSRPPTLVVDMVVTGMGNQLGAFSGVGKQTVNLVSGTYTGSYTFTLGNGDTVTATSTGARLLCVASGVYSLEETFTITGGTGAYAGAWGSGIGLGAFSAANNQIGLVLTGTVYTTTLK